MKASIVLEILEIMYSFPHLCGWQLGGTGYRGGSAAHLHLLRSGNGSAGPLGIPEGRAACPAHSCVAGKESGSGLQCEREARAGAGVR